MFNAGIIASGGQPPAVVKLASRTLPMNVWNAYLGRYHEVQVAFVPTGEISITDVGYLTDEWLLPRGAGAGAAYEIRFTRTNAAAGLVYITSAAFDVWQSLSTHRYLYTQEVLGESFGSTGTVLVEIRDAATQTIRASAIFTFQ